MENTSAVSYSFNESVFLYIKFDVNKYGFFDVNYTDNCVLTIRRSIVSRRHYCSCGDVIK